jgi:hypothetical protein
MRKSAPILILACTCLAGADDSVEKTIKDLYAYSQAAIRKARTRDELARALDTFAPEWVGNMPAGETITFADLLKEAEGGLAIPLEKRPLPKTDFVHIRQTGSTHSRWLAPHPAGETSSRLSLLEDGKPVILPDVE